MLGLAKAPRSPSGERPPGLNVKQELCCGVPKQKAKLEQMVRERGYTQPLDFADLAERRLNGELIELPAATRHYVLDVGGSATEGEFTQFSWQTNPRSAPIPKDSRNTRHCSASRITSADKNMIWKTRNIAVK